MKQDSMEKRFKRMIKAVRIGKCLVIVNHSTEILAFIKQEIKRVVKGISAGAILEAQGRKECGDSPYTNGINRGIDEAIDVFKLRITYTDNFLKGIDKVLKAYKYIEKQKIETDRLKAQQRREAGIK